MTQSSIHETGLVVAGGLVSDSQLASPNNGVYKTILEGGGHIGAGVAAATFFFQHTGVLGASTVATTAPAKIIRLEAADYAVSGLTTKLRIRLQAAPNTTDSTVTFTAGLYPVALSGSIVYTLGTVVSGSQTGALNPSTAAFAENESTDVTIPSDDYYTIGILTSGTTAASSYTALTAQLQVRNT